MNSSWIPAELTAGRKPGGSVAEPEGAASGDATELMLVGEAAEDANSIEGIEPARGSESTRGTEATRGTEGIESTRSIEAAEPAQSTMSMDVEHLTLRERPGAVATHEPEQPMPGTRIGQYEIIRPLGRGGMGEVYQARDLSLARLVAIKFLRKSTAKVRARFLAEARITARCSHENIVVIHEVGEHGDNPFLVLEYLEGHTLRAWWKANGEPFADASGHDVRLRLSPRRVVELMVPVVRALACAHAHGIVHRDLKPENIMLTRSGATKVLDFGIAKQIDGGLGGQREGDPGGSPAAMSLTGTGGIAGTLPYMSPEQLTGGEIDHRTDVWAVGIMLYELALGYHPVLRDGPASLRLVANLDVPMPSAVENAPELGALGAVIDRCLIKARADRMGSAHTLLSELEALLPGRAALAEGRSPFAGLVCFQEQDADRFFGRDSDIAGLVARVRGQPLVAAVGPSGAGKSSLVRAGLVPALERSGEGWVAHIVRPGRAPLTALASLLSSLTNTTSDPGTSTCPADATAPGADDMASSRGHLVDTLRAAPGAFGALLRSWARRKRRRVLIFVDQFEELHTLGAGADERAAFTACLDGAADDANAPVRVVLALRADFIDRLAENRSFMDHVSRGLYFVAPLDRGGLREALTRPVEAAEHRFEDPALVDEMLHALEGTPAALPLLQFAAGALWSRRDVERRTLTRAGYEAMGGVAGALAVHADNVLGTMSGAERALVRSVFLRLVTPEHTRAPAEVAELRELPGDPDAIEAVVDRLVDARLLVVESAREDAGRTVEIAHESLIGGWPTLARWLDESREDMVFLGHLRTAARQWDESGRYEGLLWRGQPAHEASLWQTRYRGELPARERAYLDAVLALMGRARRARRMVAGSVMAVLAVLLGAAIVALILISDAQEEAIEQADLARQRADALDMARRDLEASLEQAQQARHEADDARERAEEARRATEQALQESRAASRKEQDARQAAEAAVQARGQAILELEATLGKLQVAESGARVAKEDAERTAARERELKERYEQIISRALGAELEDDVPGARVPPERKP